MVKRISCRVVRSVPLDKSSGTFGHHSQSNRDSKVGVAVTVNVRARGTDNLVRNPKGHNPDFGNLTYTRRLEAAKVSIGNSLRDQVLDCYV